MRNPNPKKHHAPKDLCTIEQAEYIAERVAWHVIGKQLAFMFRIDGGDYDLHDGGEKFVLAVLRHHRWYRRLWRRITRRAA